MHVGSLLVTIIYLRCFNVDAVGRGKESPCAEVIFQEVDDLTSDMWTKRSMKKLQAELETAACTCMNPTENFDEDDEDSWEHPYYTIEFPVFDKKEALVAASKRPIPSPVVIRKIPGTLGKAMTSLEAYRSVGLTLAVVVMWAIISGIIVWALVSNDPPLDILQSILYFSAVR